MPKPKFDPTQPFDSSEVKPKFNPNQPIDDVPSSDSPLVSFLKEGAKTAGGAITALLPGSELVEGALKQFPQTQDIAQKSMAFKRGMIKSGTLGNIDPATMGPKPTQEEYSQAVEKNPVTSGVGQLAGMGATTLLAGSALGPLLKGASLPASMGIQGLAGGVEGAAMKPSGEDSLTQRAIQGGLGTLVGAAAPAVVAGLQSKPVMSVAKAVLPGAVGRVMGAAQNLAPEAEEAAATIPKTPPVKPQYSKEIEEAKDFTPGDWDKIHRAELQTTSKTIDNKIKELHQGVKDRLINTGETIITPDQLPGANSKAFLSKKLGLNPNEELPDSMVIDNGDLPELHSALGRDAKWSTPSNRLAPQASQEEAKAAQKEIRDRMVDLDPSTDQDFYEISRHIKNQRNVNTFANRKTLEKGIPEGFAENTQKEYGGSLQDLNKIQKGAQAAKKSDDVYQKSQDAYDKYISDNATPVEPEGLSALFNKQGVGTSAAGGVVKGYNLAREELNKKK